ncbi:hypothetical protein SAMN05216303_1182 [Rhodoferax sp. OV413]|uniref:hypothetical protein n=1 Tax=Rhodoferax sp. OV413 TaxID=1855285 RepID=UPI000884AB71|nr:hypothetical protein [Rhodoferax sp. OV413]SDP94986.1 hypothetical protein SAMN05216303_1182 [Rhodoferax sp. OV413]
MHRTILYIFLLGCLALLHGCDDTKTAKDVEIKRQLEGAWTYEFQDVHGRTVSGLQTLKADGKFLVNESKEHEVERSEGEWFVTDELLKQKTTQLEEKKLGTMQMLFFTCKISELQANSFTCRDDVTKQSFFFKRSLAG